MAGYLTGLNHTSCIFVKKCDKMNKLLLEKIVFGDIIGNNSLYALSFLHASGRNPVFPVKLVLACLKRGTGT